MNAANPMERHEAVNGPASRRLVFLSHANPEDNVFATWLGARLASAGYAVWSDVTKLIGGEYFWKDGSSGFSVGRGPSHHRRSKRRS